MQGHVTDVKGTAVKAAIVKLYKKSRDGDRLDPADGEEEAVTYAETDEEGRFLIQDLDPEEKYYIEIHIELSAAEASGEKAEEDEAADEKAEEDEAAGEYEEDDRIERKDIVDSLSAAPPTISSTSETICINCQFHKKTADLKNKPYLRRTNLW